MTPTITLGNSAVGTARAKSFIRFACVLLVILMVFSTMALFLSAPAYAEEGGDDGGAAIPATNSISKAVGQGMKKAYDLITSVILPIGALVFAFAATKLMVGGRKAMEEGQQRLLIILLVVAGVYLAPVIIQEIGSWFKGISGSTNIWN